MDGTKQKEGISDITAMQEKILKHENLINNHTNELKLQSQKINMLENNAIRLENVVMSENRETRQTIISTNSQLHELIKNIMGYDSDKLTTSTKLTVAKWESIVKIIGILAGSGGILYYIFS